MESIIQGQDDQFRINQVLLFLQNLCEGHNIKMKVSDALFFKMAKDYLRAQWETVKSFNLVKECVSLIVEMEKNVEENFSLGNQLFRTISEFSSGCPGNQVLSIITS